MSQEIENIAPYDEYTKDDIDISMNTLLQANNKRGPSTPLAASKTNNRRKLVQNKNDINIMKFNDIDKIDYIEMCYQNWLMKQNLERNQELLKFLELERKFNMENH